MNKSPYNFDADYNSECTNNPHKDYVHVAALALFMHFGYNERINGASHVPFMHSLGRFTLGGAWAVAEQPPPTKSGEWKALQALRSHPFTRSFIAAMHDVERAAGVANFTHDDYARWSGISKTQWSRLATGDLRPPIARDICIKLGKLYQEVLPEKVHIAPLAWATTEAWLALAGHDTFQALLEEIQKTLNEPYPGIIRLLRVTATRKWEQSDSPYKREALAILDAPKLSKTTRLRRLGPVIQDWIDSQAADRNEG